MKRSLLGIAALCALASSAHAEGLSFGADIAIGQWSNTNGGSGLIENGGLDGEDDRITGKIGLSAASDFGAFVGQIDLNYQHLEAADPSLDTDDATMQTLDVTLRAMRDFGGYQAGVFLGYGEHNDYGDSDETMFYRYIGLDVSKDMSFGEIFGQLGYLDSDDEYDEGTQDAPFLRVGASYNLANDLTLSGALSLAGGTKYGDSEFSNHVVGLELGLEKAIADTGLSVYGSYEHTQIYYDDGDKFGDNFGTVWLGLKYNLGGDTKRGGKLPNCRKKGRRMAALLHSGQAFPTPFSGLFRDSLPDAALPRC
jgi:hypothetical protein